MRRLTTISSPTRAPWLFLVALIPVLATSCRTRLPLPVESPARVATRAPARKVPARKVPGREALARDVALLRSNDFVERSRAAERLVAAGEQAVPVLGAAGEGTVRVLGNQPVATTPPVLRAIFADVEVDRLVGHLESTWPVVRRETAIELGGRGRWSAVPFLIPRMGDGDPGVRAASASSLRRLTNRFFGFDASASLHARQRATERWRDWWSIEGRVRSADGDDGAR